MHKSTSNNQRRSLNELGLVLPLPLFIGLLLIYLGSVAVIGFVEEPSLLRRIAVAGFWFVMGIVFAFKLPLWKPRKSQVAE
jgi:hypothetical protein